MKFLACVLVLLLAVTFTAAASTKKECLKACPFDYTPVCGGPTSGADKPLSFGNECVLNNYNCEKGLRWVVKSQGECPGSQGVRLS